MNYKLISSIALSLLLARWKQTLVAAVGVMFSITMFIALLGFMNGLNDLLDGLILNRTAHVRLYSEVKVNPNQPIDRANGFTSGHNFVRSIKPTNSRQEIYNSQAVLHAIRQDERVLGVAPKVSAPLFFNTGTIDITGVVNGIDAEAESRLFYFADYVTEGRPDHIASIPNSIILGKALADKLMAGIGDLIYVTTPGGERFPLKVVGYFQSGIQEFDKTQSYASLSTTQKLFGRGKSYITDIQVKLNDLEWAPAVAKEYQRLFQVDAEDIQTANSQFETGSFVRSLISYAVGITLLIVSGFGIYNILNMMIYEKMDSIAILKATGFSGKDVNRIFILIALSIGVSGGLAGLLFGLLASVGIDHIPFNTAALPTITTYPVNYDLIYYGIGLGFSLVTTYLAGLFPASKASHIDPVIIIRGK
ncbi:MAG: FtsX-like permease family protein [Imperialibacter sp.]|uniref:ABC transporter permease n=1 Tax=Imperialibacter sp. TaxID=2038411 RepID=UPI0032EDEDA8